ncbi:hypothetical protein [Ulvibacterium marinum]|uniref:GIY-YIG domain-containing protein n=1 Tax=Ulvibacterium marinum TaxID=2419782 RepID=A0A3B0CF86_9FLAO|nr:hypothetical protein [Ulvibacterium marinum]RKN83354.1 hypothetical protein D7Z94_05890 [Ulvibacterium marinum]
MKTGNYRIIDKDFWYKIKNDFPIGGGVYELYCMNKYGKTIPVNRMLGTDDEGLLYIGKAGSFLDRVIELKKSISPDYNSRGHECGARYKASKGIQEIYPYENLFVYLTSSENERILEIEKLNGYLEKFGEFPPLNRMG